MATNLAAILSAIPTLSDEERAQVNLRLRAAGSFVKKEPTVTEGDYLLEGIIAELRRRGLIGSTSRLSSRVIPSTFLEASRIVRGHLLELVGPLPPVEAAALGQLSARALVAYLERGRVPIGPVTLLRNVAKVPFALDASFPGYLEAGLLPMIWRR